MKRIYLAIAAVTIFSSAFIFSCKKSNSTTSRHDLMVGTWNLNAYGQDDNMNGFLETSEYDTIPAGIALVQTYRADGTGMFTTTVSGLPSSTNVRWVLLNGDQDLRVINDNGDTTNAVLSSITEHQAQGYDPASSPRVIFLLTK